MVQYIKIGDRSIQKTGTSLSITVPNDFVKENNIEKGDKIEIRWNGGTDLLLRAKKKE